MKFLVYAKPKASPPTIEMNAQIVKKAINWLEEKKKAGNLECGYQIVPNGGVAIVNYTSEIDLYSDLARYPFYSQFEWKINPVVNAIELFERSLESMKERPISA